MWHTTPHTFIYFLYTITNRIVCYENFKENYLLSVQNISSTDVVDYICKMKHWHLVERQMWTLDLEMLKRRETKIIYIVRLFTINTRQERS